MGNFDCSICLMSSVSSTHLLQLCWLQTYRYAADGEVHQYTTVLPLSDGAQPAAVVQHRPCLLDILLEKRAVWKKLQAT